ncbi:MAG: helix-turn-helix transcriptional regulator [Filifactor alocis]|nr:helix-turn-helix transcriptional regulator [Filifactor alocis]
MIALHQKIRRLREEKGLSKRALGKRIGKSDTHIRHIEGKQREEISLDSFCKIAKALGVTPQELLKDTEYDY